MATSYDKAAEGRQANLSEAGTAQSRVFRERRDHDAGGGAPRKAWPHPDPTR